MQYIKSWWQGGSNMAKQVAKTLYIMNLFGLFSTGEKAVTQ